MNEEYPPIGGVKVKIKDENGNYVNFTTAAGFQLSSTDFYPFCHCEKTNNTTGKTYSRLQESNSTRSEYYLASATTEVTWSKHATTPQWTRKFKTGSTVLFQMYIHDNQQEALEIVNGQLIIQPLDTNTTYFSLIKAT